MTTAPLATRQNKPDAPLPAVHLSNVRFRWNSGFGLEITDWQMAPGARVFLHGPSGSGKSTLLSLICGTISPRDGLISINGTDITQVPMTRRDRLRAESMGVIFQMFNLIPYLTALENILLPLRFAPNRRNQAGDTTATALALGERLGLDAALLKNGPAQALSIGQQQRVAVARALIGRPPLIIADEPTSALDEEAQGRFIDLLFEEATAAGATLLFVSHDQRLAERFDHKVALSDIAKTDTAR